jgi:phospholipid/cholesterol/gamma-HCH transport system substrate-binding protein
MATAIRKHLRDFIAVAGLIVIALLVTYVLVQNQRLRIPILEEKPFQLKAEFETAQAVTPGQGQTVEVAGVKIGDIAKVELDEGVAVVTMDIERDFLPIYRNATAIIRPRTGLQDVFIQLDPGSKSAGEFEDGGTIPLDRTEPEVNLDQILEALDSDTQAYLRILAVAGGQGLRGRDRDLGAVLASLGPINAELKRLNTLVAQRRQNLANLIHNLNVLSEAVGNQNHDLTRLVDTGNSALGAIASEDPNVRRALALLPGTLSTARTTLERLTGFSAELGPTFNDLRPFARRLDDISTSLRKVSKTTPAIRDEIRPLVRAAREPTRDLRPAARRLANAAPRLTMIGHEVNRLGNMVAYNPNGAEEPGAPGRDEGYLYWSGWLSRVGNSVFQTQDANGPMWRIFLTLGACEALGLLEASPLAPLVSGLEQLVAPGGPLEAQC